MSEQQLVVIWAQWMRSEGLARRTISERVRQIRRIEAAGIRPSVATSAELVEFLALGGWAPATRHCYYKCARAWFRWLQRTGRRLDNPTDMIRAPRVPRYRPRPITTEELGRTLRACNRRRTLHMILLGAYQGLRVHEIAKVRGEHVRGDELRVIGKGGTDLTIPLHPIVAQVAAQRPRTGLWFPSYRYPNEPITSQNVSTVIRRTMRRAGVDATPHQLRHWYGTHVLRGSGGNLRVAQECLRHASMSSTAIYTLVGSDELRAAVGALPIPSLVA